MPYIIDGYNYIFRDETLAELADTHSIRAARERLVAALREYAEQTQRRLVVVFDGGGDAGILGRYRRDGRLEIVFAEPVGTADGRIQELIADGGRPGDWWLVSSDKRLQVLVQQLGGNGVTSEFFRGKLQRRRPIDETARPKLSDGEVDFWLREFGLDEPNDA
jgi:predicted RNA-binding protein with PIN domain